MVLCQFSARGIENSLGKPFYALNKDAIKSLNNDKSDLFDISLDLFIEINVTNNQS